MEDFPSSYDLIIVGTGMPECILAAAAARVGKSVLHLDRNSYYGGEWASFNFDRIRKWVDENALFNEDFSPVDGNIETSWTELIGDGDQLIPCPETFPFITNVKEEIFVREKLEVIEEHANSASGEPSKASTNLVSTTSDSKISAEGDDTAIENNESLGSNSAECTFPIGDQLSANTESGLEPVCENASACGVSSAVVESELTSVLDSSKEESSESCKDATGDAVAQGASNPIDKTKDTPPAKKVWTLEDLNAQHRNFNLDLAPKLLFARGPLVELLISSNIARYAEFKCFTRLLTFINGHLEQVPCSRADVFSTKHVSVVEKRMLMKLLTFCLEYQRHPDEYRGFEGRPFLRFLRSKKLTPNIEHYVLHAIAMVDETTPTLQGLLATQKFLESLGRYGNSPFLWTCYGSAELPQCFCRLCAVFGGIYYLNRSPQAIVLDSDHKCRAIISSGQKLSCEWLVMESSYAPISFMPQQSFDRISRAILITDDSLLPDEKEQITLLRLPPVPGVRGAITVFECGPAAFVSPKGLYVVHMTCRSSAATAYDDFKPVIQELFSPAGGSESTDQIEAPKPKILWQVFFNQKDTSVLDLNTNVPSNVLLTSSPGMEHDYDGAVKEAQDLFSKMYPEEEFLPRAPDPEDIVMEEVSNPGEAADGQAAGGESSAKEEALESSAKEEAVELVEKADETSPSDVVEPNESSETCGGEQNNVNN